MNFLHDEVSFAIAGIGGILSWFFGAPDTYYTALIVFLVIDHIVFQAATRLEHKHTRENGAKDIIKKFMIIILVGIANVIDHILFSKPTLRTAVIFFYISNQGISIITYATDLGLPVPKQLKDILDQIKEKNKPKEKVKKL